jgi:hypothetical protein
MRPPVDLVNAAPGLASGVLGLDQAAVRRAGSRTAPGPRVPASSTCSLFRIRDRHEHMFCVLVIRSDSLTPTGRAIGADAYYR